MLISYSISVKSYCNPIRLYSTFDVTVALTGVCEVCFDCHKVITLHETFNFSFDSPYWVAFTHKVDIFVSAHQTLPQLKLWNRNWQRNKESTGSRFMIRISWREKLFLDSLIRITDSKKVFLDSLFRIIGTKTLFLDSLIRTSYPKNLFLDSLFRTSSSKMLFLVSLFRNSRQH